jgi:hypothetical protein
MVVLDRLRHIDKNNLLVVVQHVVFTQVSVNQLALLEQDPHL